MNTETEYAEKKRRLKEASLKVRNQSMLVNKEFSDIEHDPEN